MQKLTKIVCTIGPASGTEEILERLINSGMNVARFNFSHGEHVEKAEKIQTLKKLMQKKGVYISLLLDTKGPEIRTYKLENGQPVKLVAGDQITIVHEDIIGNKDRISLTYKNLHNDIKPGNQILIADGAVILEATEIVSDNIICKVMNSCELGERKNVNLPGIPVKLPVLEDKDKADLIFGCEQGLDYVAASFITRASDVAEVRKFLDDHGGKHIKIISKIENQEGLDNFEEILALTDGVMVARGDLGMEIAVQKMPLVQKMMIRRCNEEGKIVITATQMLDSMIKNPRPTRAEATDVANAIFDGTDAVMLSGETANGAYPVEAVDTMSKICTETDQNIKTGNIDSQYTDDITLAVARGTVDTANALNAKYIVTASIGGRTAMAVRKYFPKQPILVFTNHEQVARKVNLVRGCQGFVVDKVNTYEEFFAIIQKTLLTAGLVRSGDVVVVTGGGSIGQIGVTDTIKVLKI